MCYIYLLQLGYQPVAVAGKLAQKQERDSTKGETIHKTIQKHGIHKIENKRKRILKNIWQVII